MTGKILWQSIKALVACDKDITKNEEEISITEKNLDSADKQIDALRKHVEDDKNRLVRDKKNMDFYDLEAKTLEDKESVKREQLNTIKNQKEYKALEKEIESISLARKDLDDLMLRSYHQADLETTKAAKGKEIAKQNIEQITVDIETKKTLLSTLKEELANAQNKREELAAKIPKEWLTRYERMKNSVSDPIVQATNACCSACFYQILHKDMATLKKAGLLPCRSCYRFLYFDEEEQNEIKQATF